MTYIPLNRRFAPHDRDQAFAVDIRDHFGFGLSNGIGWDEVLERQRVVVLAEASAGKTEEFREQVRRLRDEDKHAFFVTLEAIAANGLDRSLGRDDAKRFDEWSGSEAIAWFFLDSIDEARINQKDIETALHGFARGLGGAYDRARVVLSCRGTVWAGEDDVRLLRNTIGMDQRKPQRTLAETPSDDVLFDPKGASAAVVEAPAQPDVSVVIMTSLTRAQRASFLVQAEITDVDEFETALFKHNLRQFAERPGDLLTLVRYWKKHQKFDGLSEMTEVGIDVRLDEMNKTRRSLATRSLAEVRAAAERLAAAMTFARTMTIRVEEVPGNEDGIDPHQVLSDWLPAEVDALLQRGLFVPSTFGFRRFFHRSAQEYLTAGWFERMGERLTDEELLATFVSDGFEIETIPPSLRPAAAWLAAQRPTLRARILAGEPIILLLHGDPQKLTLGEKRSLLLDVAERQKAGAMAYARIDHQSLWMFAEPALAESVNEAIAINARPDFQREMLALVEQGKLAGCRDFVRAASVDPATGSYDQIVATRALKAIGDDVGLKALAADLVKRAATLKANTAPYLVDELFPAHLSVGDLLEIVLRSQPARQYHSSDGFAQSLAMLFERCKDASDRRTFVTGIAEAAFEPPLADWPLVSKRHSELLKGTGPLARLAVPDNDDNPHGEPLVRLLMAAERAFEDRSNTDQEAISELVAARPTLLQDLFWADVRDAVESERPSRLLSIRSVVPGGRCFWGLTVDDRPWLEAALDRADRDEARIVLSALIIVARLGNSAETDLDRLATLVAHHGDLTKQLTDSRAPSVETKEERDYRLSHERREANAKVREERRRAALLALRARLEANPETLIDPEHLNTKMGFQDLLQLSEWLAGSASSGYNEGARHWKRLSEAFGPTIAESYRAGMAQIWRVTPPVRPVWNKDGSRTVKYAIILSEAGLSLESEGDGWIEKLSPDEIERAIGHVCLDDMSLPRWLPDLLDKAPAIVTPYIGELLDRELSAGTEYRPLLERLANDFPRIPQIRAKLMSAFAGPLGESDALGAILAKIVSRFELTAQERSDMLVTLKARALQFRKDNKVPQTTGLLAAMYHLDPDAATATLMEAVGLERRRRSASQAFALVSGLFGRHRGIVGSLHRVSAPGLVAILKNALVERNKGTARPDEEDEDDVPIRGRFDECGGEALNALASTDGSEAYAAMLALATDGNAGTMSHRFRELAYEMAERQSERPVWTPKDIVAFEETVRAPVKTGTDLFRLVVRVLKDVAASFTNQDMSAKSVLLTAKDEEAVQDWLGSELNNRSHGRIHAAKEAEIAHHDRPDLIVSSTTSADQLAIEIKHGDKNWTLPDLRNALLDQLATRYLRTPERRSGVLVISNHRESRTWRDKEGGKSMRFPTLIDSLSELAQAKTDNDTGRVRIGVIGIDPTAERKRKTSRPTSSGASKKAAYRRLDLTMR